MITLTTLKTTPSSMLTSIRGSKSGKLPPKNWKLTSLSFLTVHLPTPQSWLKMTRKSCSRRSSLSLLLKKNFKTIPTFSATVVLLQDVPLALTRPPLENARTVSPVVEHARVSCGVLSAKNVLTALRHSTKVSASVTQVWLEALIMHSVVRSTAESALLTN